MPTILEAPVRFTVQPRTRVFLRILFYVLVLAAFGYFLSTIDWAQVSGLSFDWGMVALATVLALAFRYLAAIIWRAILVELGARDLPRFRILADVFARAWMARYIPGTVPSAASRVYFAAEHGVPTSELAVATVVEPAAQISGAGVTSLILMSAIGHVNQIPLGLRITVAAVVAALVISMLPPVLNPLVAWIFGRLKRRAPQRVGWQLPVVSVALFAVAAVAQGLSDAVITKAVYPALDVWQLAFIAGAFVFAGVVGMLTPVVPAGFGTRDATLLVLLLAVLPASVAAIVVVLSRLWIALVDLLFWGICAALARTVTSVRRSESIAG